MKPDTDQPVVAEMASELDVYLNTLTVTSDNIGDVRRSCFVPWESKWNGLVRDKTAEREVSTEPPTKAVPTCAGCGHNNLNSNGECIELVNVPTTDVFRANVECGCHCVFPVSEAGGEVELAPVPPDAFDDWAPFSPRRIAAGEYEIRNKGMTVRFEVEGRAFAEWICGKLNTRTSQPAQPLPTPTDEEVARKIYEDARDLVECRPSHQQNVELDCFTCEDLEEKAIIKAFAAALSPTPSDEVNRRTRAAAEEIERWIFSPPDSWPIKGEPTIRQVEAVIIKHFTTDVEGENQNSVR